MPLGKEVGLGPGHIMLDGDLAPHSSPSPLSAHAYCGPSQQRVTSISRHKAVRQTVLVYSPPYHN